MNKNKWNISGGLPFDMSGDGFSVAYRAQSYKSGFNEENANDPSAYSFYNFTDDPNRRFVPSQNRDTAYYMGFSPLAVFVETNADFREVSLKHPRPLLFSEAELKRTEIIAFEGFGDLYLFDLSTEFALSRHNLRPHSPELVSVDYSISSVLADAIYDEGYDGIMFRTRQGILNAAVIWGRAKDKISQAKIKYRQSALTMIRNTPDAERLLSIKIDPELD